MMVTDQVCTACGAPLDVATTVCAHCGTVNVVAAPTEPVIDVDPDGLAPAVDSGRILDGTIAPIVFGQRTMIEGAESAIVADPAPWEEAPARAVAGSAPPARTSVLLAVLAALLVVPAVGGIWLSSRLTSETATVDLFEGLHREPAVAAGLGDALIAQLAADGSVTAADRDEATEAATSMIADPGFGPSWQTVVRDAHSVATAGLASSEPYTVGVDLTTVVDRLRTTEVRGTDKPLAAPNAEAEPIPLTPPVTAPPAAGFLRALTVGSFVVTGAGLAMLVAAVIRSNRRTRTIQVFGGATAAWGGVLGLAAWFVVPSMIGDPTVVGARPLVSEATRIVARRLSVVYAVIAFVGLIVCGVASLLLRGGRRDATAAVTV